MLGFFVTFCLNMVKNKLNCSFKPDPSFWYKKWWMYQFLVKYVVYSSKVHGPLEFLLGTQIKPGAPSGAVCSFKHGKDTFDRSGARGKNGEGNVARGRVSSPFTPVDDDSKAVAPPRNIWRPRRLPLSRFFPGLSTITDLKIMVGRLQNLDREPKLPNIWSNIGWFCQIRANSSRV